LHREEDRLSAKLGSKLFARDGMWVADDVGRTYDCSILLRRSQRLVLSGAEMLQTGTLPTILVVEDYTDTQQMLKLLLEDSGFRVLTATTGNDALALAHRDIDLVLTDFSLPDMTGPNVVRRLRQINARLKYVPTIVLTAFDGGEYRNRAFEAGCDAFIVKPPNFDSLLVIIDRLLRTKQTPQQALVN